MAATSPPRRVVSLHVDPVTLRTRLGAASSAPNHRDKALEAQCARHAQRHASDPTNHDVLYAWGLTLQERAECAEETAASAPQQQQRGCPGGGTDATGHARQRGSHAPDGSRNAVSLETPASSSRAAAARAARDAYLRAACDAYAKAVSLHPRHASALYNHGIALGDLARAAQGKDPESAAALWKKSCAKYARAVVAAESGSATDPKRPLSDTTMRATTNGEDASASNASNDVVRALNNWGLAEQRLAGLASSAPARLARLARAASRFREALRRDPSFDRAAYNLGTVMYALAELAARRARKLEAAASAEEAAALEALADPGGGAAGAVAGESAPAEAAGCRAAAAMHICLAAAATEDDASRRAYRAALALVRRALPAPPFFFAGPLRREREQTGGARGDDSFSERRAGWRARATFAADHASFRELIDSSDGTDATEARGDATEERADDAWAISLGEIARVAAAPRDASFPLARGERGFFLLLCDGKTAWFVAPDEPQRDLWVDALSMASDIATRGRSGALERELETRE